MAKPLPPSQLKLVRSPDRTSMFLMWDSVTHDIANTATTILTYEIYVADVNNGLHYQLAASVSPSLAFRQYLALEGVPGVIDPDVAYSLRMAAINADGISEFSEEVTDY